MKTLVTAAALAAFALASPALAQSANSNHVYTDGTLATQHPHNVVHYFQIIGRDPDGHIRFALWREAQFLEGGAE